MKSTKPTKPTKQIVLKILDVLSHGLTKGKGDPEPGKMCVEAAICFAYGLPHSDKPPCVGSAVRAFKIALNDCNWSCHTARAEGMKFLAIAQLGSDEINQREFSKLMFLRGTQKLMPYVFRREAKRAGDKKTALREHADKCEAVTTFEAAREATCSAYASAYANSYAYASAYAYAYASAYSYAYASAYASASFYASAENDALLLLAAQVGLDVLKEMKAPGCKWLHLAEEAPSVPEGTEEQRQPLLIQIPAH